MSYSGRRILVIGGTGFVGGRLSEQLLVIEKAEVRVLVRDWTKAVWISRTTATLVQGDVLDRASLDEAVRDCKVVFHCANGPSRDGGYRRTNVEGTQNVLDACEKAGVGRLVYVSSIAVHGPDPPAELSDDTPYVELGRDYSDSKIAAERLLIGNANRSPVEIVIVRPTFVWGPRSNLFATRQLREMRQGTFKLVDRGRGSCHAVYIDNLVEALLLAGEHSGAPGRAFLVTDGLDVTWADFFRYYQEFLGIGSLPSINAGSALCRSACNTLDVMSDLLNRLQGNPAPLWRKVVRRSARIVHGVLASRYMSSWDLLKFARVGGANIGGARRVLGYCPSVDLDGGMRATLDWARDQLGVELGVVSPDEAAGGMNGRRSGESPSQGSTDRRGANSPASVR